MRWIQFSASNICFAGSITYVFFYNSADFFYFESPFCHSGGNSELTSLCWHSSPSPGSCQSFSGLCSAKKLEYGSQISSIFPIRLILNPSPAYSARSLNWMEHIDRVLFPLASRWNYPSLFDAFPFWSLQSCCVFSPSSLPGLTGLLLLGPGSCTLHCASTLVIPPSVNNPSPNSHAVRVPGISSCDAGRDVHCPYRDTEMSFTLSGSSLSDHCQLQCRSVSTLCCCIPAMLGTRNVCLPTSCVHSLPLCI